MTLIRPTTSGTPDRPAYDRRMQEGSPRAIVAAFSANCGIPVAKFVGFFAMGAASMVARLTEQPAAPS